MPSDSIAANLHYLWYYLIAINAISFIVYKYDKLQSTRKGNRISEKNLLLLALLGGSIGSLLGMYFLQKHKTNKWQFNYGIPLIMIAQIGIAFYLYFK